VNTGTKAPLQRLEYAVVLQFAASSAMLRSYHELLEWLDRGVSILISHLFAIRR